jgi:TetR/AcrR family transcriptional repressor of mexJK operon
MDAATPSVSSRKRDAILRTAQRSFLHAGFGGTNLDEVAAAAGTSKVTVYSHFGSKEKLFIAVIEEVIAQLSASGPALNGEVEQTNFQDSLTAIATDIVETVRDPVVVGMRRVLIAEQPRHPSLASAWRAAAVTASVDELAAYFAQLQRRRLLRTFDTQAVAQQFLWMLIGDALDAGLLDPAETPPPAHATAERAVETLLSAYAETISRMSFPPLNEGTHYQQQIDEAQPCGCVTTRRGSP